MNENFFIIDSRNMMHIETKLYGYVVSERGIFDRDNVRELLLADIQSGMGAFVYVVSQDKTIDIYQDAMGSWGIFIYKAQGFFVVSNSLYRIINYLRTTVCLSLNTDYAMHLMLDELGSKAFQETIIKEIIRVERNSVIHINTSNNSLEVSSNKNVDFCFDLDSKEGIDIVDDWYERWTSIIQNICKKTNQVIIDLSGGIDSRISFMLALCSGIDMNDVYINSTQDNKNGHSEDFRIANEIAVRYGLVLNKKENLNNECYRYDLDEALNIEWSTRLGVHKAFYFRTALFKEKRYRITGGGGECIRGKRANAFNDFIKKECELATKYGEAHIVSAVYAANERILKRSFEVMKDFAPNILSEKELALEFYRAGWNRSHFGGDRPKTYSNMK